MNPRRPMLHFALVLAAALTTTFVATPPSGASDSVTLSITPATTTVTPNWSGVAFDALSIAISQPALSNGVEEHVDLREIDSFGCLGQPALPIELTPQQIAMTTIALTDTLTITCNTEFQASLTLLTSDQQTVTVQSQSVIIEFEPLISVKLRNIRVARPYFASPIVVTKVLSSSSMPSDTIPPLVLERRTSAGAPWVTIGIPEKFEGASNENPAGNGQVANTTVWGTAPGPEAFRATVAGSNALGAALPATSNEVTLRVGSGAIPDWLRQVNAYRNGTGLPSVGEEVALDTADAAHVHYMETGIFGSKETHYELPGDPRYTPLGNRAAESSVLDASPSGTFISDWMRAPFHALDILSPQLHVVGFAQGGLYAALYVLSDDIWRPSTSLPQFWPADGSTINVHEYTGEFPPATSGCPVAWRNASAVGLPVIVSLGSPRTISTGRLRAVMKDGSSILPTCLVTAHNYRDPGFLIKPVWLKKPIEYETSVGRGALEALNSVFVIPLHPLVAGHRYVVQLIGSGHAWSWSFRVSNSTID